jgi:hypothetical protein
LPLKRFAKAPSDGRYEQMELRNGRNGLISNYFAHLARADKTLAENNKTPTESRAYLSGSAGK